MKYMRKIAALVLAAGMVTGSIIPAFAAEESGAEGDTHASAYGAEETENTAEPPNNPDPVYTGEVHATKLSGVAKKRTRKFWTDNYKQMSDKITVKPAWGREVYLEEYVNGKWVTRRTYTTPDRASASVKLVYPDTWKSRYYSPWRIRTEAQAAKTIIGEEGAHEEYPGAAAAAVKVKVYNTSLSAATAAVYDAKTGKLVFQKKATKKRYPASMTKMMTAVLLTEKKKTTTKLKVSKKAHNTPWGIGLLTGDKITVGQCLYAMMLPSANDAAVVAAEGVSGSTSKFAKLMNKKANSLGMTDTYFVTPHGLDDSRHKSTAYDMAKLGAYIMTSPKQAYLRKVVKKKITLKTKRFKKVYKLYNTDRLLGSSYGLEGIKTGSTTKGGCCFTGTFQYRGRRYITVTMGSSSDKMRWTDTANLVKFTKESVKKGLGELPAE